MSKGVELFNHYKYEILSWTQISEEDLDIIEQALKDYDYWVSFVKCYGDIKAEDLQRFIHNGWAYEQSGYKKDKAFDVIKEKKVNVTILMGCDSLEEYNKHPLSWKKLTQEEWDLLKEVLK